MRTEPNVSVVEVIKDYPTMLDVDGSCNIAGVIVSPVGPQLALVNGPGDFLKNYTQDGVTIPRDAHISFINFYYMSFFSSLVLSRAMNSTATGGIEIFLNPATTGDDPQPESFIGYPTYFKDGVELTKKYSLGISGFPEGDTKNWGFIMDDVIYYGGDLATVLAGFRVGTDVVDLSGLEAVACDALYDETATDTYAVQILDYLASEINKLDVYTVVRTASGLDLYRDAQTEDPIVDKVDLVNEDGELITATVTPVGVTINAPASATDIIVPAVNATKLFTIMDKTPGTLNNNPNSVSISKTRVIKGHKVFDLTLQAGVGEPETYVVSLDKEAVDSSEVNCFIEGLNSIAALEFSFIAEEGVGDLAWTAKLQNKTFGEGFISEAASSSTPYLKQAIEALEDQESYMIDYLSCAGITSVSFVKTMAAIGIRNKWFLPIDVPYDRTNANSIAAYGNNIVDNYDVSMVGPFDKNVGLTGWVNYIAASTLYYERVMTNRSQQNEFAPVFDQTTGQVAYTNPVKLLKKNAREKLLSLAKPINYVIYNQNNESYYFNDNWTHYSQSDNVMGEENNVRLTHKISRDLEQLYQQFKAKQNSAQTRAAVNDVTKLYFDTVIMNQVTHPQEWLVICDESNNTADIIRGRKLAITVKIRLFNSIKWITVVNEVYSVGGSAFTE